MLNTTRVFKTLSRILFFAAVFFTTVCFVETWRTPFFLNGNYKILKFALCVAVPFAASIINYLCEKDFTFIGNASTVIMCLFVIFYIIDKYTVNFIAYYGNFVIIFHLAYALVSSFSVFITCTLIKSITKDKNNHYNSFFDNYFIGFAVMLFFIFVLIYFIIRDYSGDYGYGVNLIPFNGELKKLADLNSISKYSLVRSIGNVFVYTAIAITTARFLKNKKSSLIIFIPIMISVLAELFQYIFNCGDADIDDIITNTAGVLIGAAIYKLIIKPLLQRSKI